MIGNKWRKHTTQAGSGLSETTPSDTFNNSTGIRGMEKWTTTRFSLSIPADRRMALSVSMWKLLTVKKVRGDDGKRFFVLGFHFFASEFWKLFSARTISEPSRQLIDSNLSKKNKREILMKAQIVTWSVCRSTGFWNIFGVFSATESFFLQQMLNSACNSVQFCEED